MTKEEFKKLKAGDRLIFRNRKIRRIEENNGSVVTLLKSNKNEKYEGDFTYYAYHDLVRMGVEIYIEQRDLVAEMQFVCEQVFEDGEPVYFYTLGRRSAMDGTYMVRIRRMPLHYGKTLHEAIIMALDEFYKETGFEPLIKTNPNEETKS